MPKRLGFFTRLLDQGSAQTRYRLAAEQIRHAERLGFDSAWIAQHHFHEQEGGLPSPLVFLAHVAAQTDRIRLGTAIITLPMENLLRVAEDAAVLDLLTDGRLEVGFGSGGTPTSFLPFGLTSEQRGAAFADHLHLIHSAARRHAEPPGQPSLSAGAAVGGAYLDRHLLGGGRHPRRSGGTRADAVPHPATAARRATSAAGRHSEPDHRRLPVGATGRRCAADPRLAHRLRRRQSRPRPAGRRARSAQAGDSAPGGGSYDRR